MDEINVSSQDKQTLVDKILKLPEEKVQVVQDFVDSLSYDDEHVSLVRAYGKLSEEVLKKVWDNPDDAEYDKL